MSRIVRVSAVQMATNIAGRSFAEKQARNRRHIQDLLRIAGERASDLVLFGEYANLHHRTWSNNRREYVADEIPGPCTRMIARAARKYKMNVAFPMLGNHQGVVASFVVLFDRAGKIVGCYQKAHTTEPEQHLGMRTGNELSVFKLDFGTVGIMTCMDIEYPEVAQILMLKGAEILLFPHVQAGWGEVDWEIRYRARAVDTGLYLVSACYGYPAGEWKPGMMIGRSGAVGREGLILADLGRGIGVMTVELDLAHQRVTPFFFEKMLDRTSAIMASRRPEIYGELVDRSTQEKALQKLARQRKKP